MSPVPRSFPRFLLAALLLSFAVSLAAQDLPSPADLPFAGAGWKWTAPEELSAPVLEPAVRASSVAAASMETEGLVAWESWSRIVAARFAADGTLLDEPPIVLGATSERDASMLVFQRTPRIATNGERYLVVWRNGAKVEGQFVGRDGGLLGGVMTFPGLANNDSHFVASNGESFAVSTGAVVTIVSTDGRMTQTEKLIEWTAALASDGEDYLVTTPRSTAGASSSYRFSESGALVSTTQQAGMVWESLAWTGTEYLAFSSAQRALQRLDRDGKPSGPLIPVVTEPIPLRAVILPRGPGSALIALAGPFTGPSWQMRLARLDGDAVTLGDPLPPVIDYPVALAHTGHATYAFWSAISREGTEVKSISTHRGEIEEGALAIVPSLGVSSAFSAPDQADIRSTATTDGFFAAWVESTEETKRLRGAVITRAGTTASELTIAVAVSPNTVPALARGDGVVMAAWYDYRERRGLWIRRFSEQGLPLDVEPQRIATLFSDSNSDRPAPAVTWNGEAFVLAWPANKGITVARVSETGILLDPEGILIPARESFGQPSSLPALASTGAVTLLVWQEGIIEECRLSGCYVPPARVWALRLDRDLGYLDPAPFGVAPDHLLAFPRVAANDGVFLVTAGELRKGALAVRINAAGRVLDSPPLKGLFAFNGGFEARALESAEGVAATAVPGGFLLATATAESRCCEVELAKEHMQLVWVPREGMPPPPIRLFAEWRSFPHPHLSALPDGTTSVVYTTWREHAGVARRATIQMLRPFTPARQRTVRR